MKITLLLCGALLTGFFSGCESEKHEAHEKEAKQATLLAQAKISRETAQQAALARVPNGTIKEGELEKEHGKLIWSFDIAIPDSKDIKEVAVNAISGEVISVDTETAADQAKEAAEDAKKNKSGTADKD